MNFPVYIHFFVYSFIVEDTPKKIRNNVQMSSTEILEGILRRIHLENRDNYIYTIKNKSRRYFKVSKKIKLFFDNCSIIAKVRGEEDIIIPEIMNNADIMKYVWICKKYCFVNDKTDQYVPYIPIEEDLEYQKYLIDTIREELDSIVLRKKKKYFIDTMQEELYSIVLSPDRIKYWIHYGFDIDLTHFNDHAKFI